MWKSPFNGFPLSGGSCLLHYITRTSGSRRGWSVLIWIWKLLSKFVFFFCLIMPQCTLLKRKILNFLLWAEYSLILTLVFLFACLYVAVLCVGIQHISLRLHIKHVFSSQPLTAVKVSASPIVPHPRQRRRIFSKNIGYFLFLSEQLGWFCDCHWKATVCRWGNKNEATHRHRWTNDDLQ